MSQKKLQSDFPHQLLSKYRINPNIISGYETITYYLHFAENPIRFGQVVTQKMEFHKVQGNLVITSSDKTRYRFFFMCCSMEIKTVYNEL